MLVVPSGKIAPELDQVPDGSQKAGREGALAVRERRPSPCRGMTANSVSDPERPITIDDVDHSQGPVGVTWA